MEYHFHIYNMYTWYFSDKFMVSIQQECRNRHYISHLYLLQELYEASHLQGNSYYFSQ